MKVRLLYNEAALLEQLSQGYEPAFKHVYDYYAPAVYRVASRYLQSGELADDVVQEVFMTIWNRRSETHAVRCFRHYLFTVTRNLCLQYLKEKTRSRRVHLEFFERTELDGPDYSEMYSERLSSAVEKLPGRQRQIFEMAKLQGMSHETIARHLNLSASTVNNHISSALKTLRESLRHVTISVLVALLLFLP